MLSLKKLKENIATAVKVEQVNTLPILDAIQDDAVAIDEPVEESNYLFPFRNLTELREKFVEIKNFFTSIELPTTKKLFGKHTYIGNPKEFILTTIQLIEDFKFDYTYVRDRVCELEFLKKSF